jgi:hypothetical protein
MPAIQTSGSGSEAKRSDVAPSPGSRNTEGGGPAIACQAAGRSQAETRRAPADPEQEPGMARAGRAGNNEEEL